LLGDEEKNRAGDAGIRHRSGSWSVKSK
jgi:hypothetical protein